MNEFRSADDLAQPLGALLERLRAETGVPGIGVAVSIRGQRVFASSGVLAAEDPAPLRSDARFELGCIVKLLLAITALELAARGALGLDESIGDYLPELRTTVHGRTIRVRHLLSHTSGYHGIDVLEPASRALTWEKLVAYLHVAPQFFRPGAVFSYEHSEAVLLARILERVAGEDSAALVRRIVLEPVGGAASQPSNRCAPGVRVASHRYDSRLARFVLERAAAPSAFWQAAFSSLTLTLPDLVAVAEALAGVTDAAARGGASAAAVQAARAEAVTLPPMAGGPLRELLPIAFGLGAAVLRRGYFGSTGIAGGQCVGLRYDPVGGVAVAVGLNAFVPHLRDMILATVCASVADARLPAERDGRPELELGELAGEYRGSGTRTVRARYVGERLVCAIGRDGSPHVLTAELAADDTGRWILQSPAPQLSVGAFREPGGGAPALLVGLSAFKRVHGSQPATRMK